MSTSVAHQARNWLHHMMLAAIVAEAATVAKGFARFVPLEIIGAEPEQRWENWSEWSAFLEEEFRDLVPTALSLHLAQSPTILWDETNPSEVALRWRMVCSRRGGSPAPLDFAYEATLVEEQGRWVAARLRWSRATPSV